MNLVQLANDLEYVPKEQLAEMSQDPNAHYPPYLVLAEIQRRTQNEKAYAAAQPQPTTTVAEEVVSEFMQPQGLQAGMPPESAPTDIFSSGMSGMPASAPPIGMAKGGETLIDKWFGNEILNPFVSDTGTAKWYNPVAGLPHVQYSNLMETGEPMQGLPLDFSKDINEELGLYTPGFNLEEYEKRKQEELEKLYAENPQAFLVGSSGIASGGSTSYSGGGRTGYLIGGQGTVNPLPPTGRQKANQAMYGLENMASSYFNPYSGMVRGGLNAVGNMGIGDQVVNPNALNFLNNANNTLDRVVSGTLGALIPGGSTPLRDRLRLRRARQSSGQEAYDENVEALSREDERRDAASGGRTGYFEGGVTDLTDEEYYSGGLRDMNQRLRNQSRIDAVETSAQMAETEGLDAAGQPLMSSQLVNQNLEPDEMEMGMAGGGLTAYAAGDRIALSSSFDDPYSNVGGAFGTAGNPYPDQSFLSRGGEKISNFFSNRYQDEDGLDWSNIGLDAASAGLMFIPGIGWMAAGGLRAASLAANAARAGQVVKTGAQALKTAIPKTITKPGRVVKSKTGKEFGVNTTQGKSILSGKNPPKSFRSPNVPRDPSLTRASIATGAGLAGAMNLNYALDDTYNLDNKDIDTELSQADKDYNKRMQDIVLANQQAQLDQNALDQKKANRMFSPTDLIQLGGTVMGARDMSELGQGIAGVAGLSAQRKADEKQAGLQARYLQAQTGKLEAETAQLPERQILAEITGLTKQLSDLEESGGDDVQIQKIRDYLQYLSGELARIRGYDPSMIAGNNQNVIASYT